MPSEMIERDEGDFPKARKYFHSKYSGSFFFFF